MPGKLHTKEMKKTNNGTGVHEKSWNKDMKTRLLHGCEIIMKGNETKMHQPGRLNTWVKSDRFKLIACKVHKAGSTNIARILYTLDHLSEINNTNKISKGKARNNAVYRHKETVESFQMNYKSYKKFMFVRDPLERLLSAYRAKLPRGMFKTDNLTFAKFLDNVLTKPDETINIHLVSFIRMCKPCSIMYDFIGTVDNFDDDMRRILKSVNAANITIPERNQTGYNTEKSSEVLQAFLKDVPKSLVRRIYERYYWDYFLFGFAKPDF